jgi:hypothetical protein
VVAVGDFFFFGFKLQAVLFADLVAVVAIEQQVLPVHFPDREWVADAIPLDVRFELLELVVKEDS